MTIPLVRIVGRSGSGRTTLLEKLIPVLQARGLRVATIKHHAHPDFTIDQPGKDTWRHYEAGAEAVMIVSPVKMAIVRRLIREPSLAELAGQVQDVDIILTEGFNRDSAFPRIEVVRASRSAEPLNAPHEVLAYVSDLPLDGAPCFALDDASGLADFLISRLVTRVQR